MPEKFLLKSALFTKQIHAVHTVYIIVLYNIGKIKGTGTHKPQEGTNMKYTEKELYEFVWRADTHEKIVIAEKWLKSHVTDNDLFDDLMITLSQQNRALSAEEEGREHHI